MLTWIGCRGSVKQRVGDLGKDAPEAVKGYLALAGSGEKAKHLDAGTR